jgi:asparagine synthetase B (glutamine-hydrolysing)
MFRYRGAVDFRRLTAPVSEPLPITQRGDVAQMSFPGIELDWRVGAADVAYAQGVLVVATGRARGLSSTHGDGQAARWLSGYIERGERLAEEVGGGYAVIVIDVAARRAHLFVDRFSIETLCYRAAGTTLRFSDRACDAAEPSDGIEAQSIYDYLYFHVIPAPQTLFANVHRLLPAHIVTVSDTGLEKRRFWNPVFVENDRRHLHGRMRDFRHIVERSVAEEADEAATACFLSGGTDSSTIAGMLRQMRGQPVHAYSIGFEAEGYDELYGGNSRYATQKLLQAYHGVPRIVRNALLEPVATRCSLFRRAPVLRKIGGYVRHARPPLPDRLETFNLVRQFDPDLLFEPALRARVDTARPLEQQRAQWRLAPGAALINRMLAYEWKYILADSDLPKVRGAAQLAGVTVGYPFLARASADFSLALPPDWKVKGLRLRWFFKEALRDFLPAAILSKKKHGFGLPFGTWTLRHAGLRELAEDSLAGIAARGVVRQPFVRDLMDRHLPEAPGYYGEMVWLLMMLEQWLRAHAGNRV